MEQGVVRGADGTAQIRPPRPAGVDLGKVGGCLDEVLWCHDALLRLLPDLGFGDERDDGKRLHVRALKFGVQAVIQSNPYQGVRKALGTVAVVVGEAYQKQLVAVAVVPTARRAWYPRTAGRRARFPSRPAGRTSPAPRSAPWPPAARSAASPAPATDPSPSSDAAAAAPCRPCPAARSRSAPASASFELARRPAIHRGEVHRRAAGHELPHFLEGQSLSVSSFKIILR